MAALRKRKAVDFYLRIWKFGVARNSMGVRFHEFPRLLSSVLRSVLGKTGIPGGLAPVRNFESERYLGTWYEIARLDHPFERGLEDVSATYTMSDDGGIRVRNRGFDVAGGGWREAVGRAYANDDPTLGSLAVSFFGPFYGATT